VDLGDRVATLQKGISMKIFLFLALALVSSFAQAADDFPTVYRDKYNGLKWSRIMPRLYTNGCWGNNGFGDYSKCTVEVIDRVQVIALKDSDAAQACANINGRLPNSWEFESLISNFDYDYNGYGYKKHLTAKGLAQMEAIFGNMKVESIYDNNKMKPRVFATGSIYTYPEYQHVFATGTGQMSWGYRYSALSVLCVSGPFTPH
jgi:hypothetical protein